MTRPGVFISFEGGDGSGKSTHAKRLAAHLEAHGYEVCHVHEPGGTELGERVRDILLDRALDGMETLSELFLYEAARAQLVAEVIEPALAQGKVVLCDRFTDSTVAYQGYGRGLGAELVGKLNELSCHGVSPDRTILMLVDPDEGIKRAVHASKRGDGDRIENAGEQFHQQVAEGFAALEKQAGERIRTVDATMSKPEVQLAVFAEVADLFPDVPAPVVEDAQ